MQLLKFAAALQACIAVAFAAPQSIEKRGQVGVYLCEANGWKGHCEHQYETPGKCHDIGPALNTKVSCIGPDKNAGRCSFFIGSGCTGIDHIDFTYPGSDYYGTHFNDVIGSWRCPG